LNVFYVLEIEVI